MLGIEACKMLQCMDALICYLHIVLYIDEYMMLPYNCFLGEVFLQL